MKMAEKPSDYDKSIIDIKIKFDEDREKDFKNILRKQFGNKLSFENSDEDDETKDKLEFLEADFSKREIELKKFRKQSQSACSAPILTKALVKKTKKRLTESTSSFSNITGLQRFRTTARIIIIFLTLSKKWIRYHIDESAEKEKEGSAKSLSAKYFKTSSTKGENKDKVESKKTTKSKYRVSEELQESLRKLPTFRQEEDLIKIQRFCRKIGALSNFPVEREMDVARYISYERYDKGRVLCLQGRNPDRFYFILSGRVNKVKTIELTSGIKKQYFGQLYQGTTTDPNELQLKKPREHSLVCKTSVDLLLIEREDFLNLLATKSSLDNSNTAFLRSIDVFQSFPLDSVESETMTTKYFPKDSVIVKDMNESPHFFIIKSGTCKLLQKHVIDKRGVPIVKKDFLPRINRGSVSLSFTTNSTDDNPILTDAKKLHSDVSTFLEEPNGFNDNTETQELTTKDVEIVSNKTKRSIKVTNAKFGRPRRKRSSKAIPTLSELICGKKEEKTERSRSNSKKESELKLPLITLNNSTVQQTSGSPLSNRRDTRRSTQYSGILPLIKKPEKPDRDAYLQIGCLKKGDIYGLDSLMQRAASIVQAAVTLTVHPSLTEKLNVVVISEGTECILVNKKLFLKSADFGTLARMVSMYQTQTTAEEAKEQVEKRINWGSYKRKIVRDILKRSKNKHKVFAYR